MSCPLSGDESEATIQWVRNAESALCLTNDVIQAFANGQPVPKDLLRLANEAMGRALATSQ